MPTLPRSLPSPGNFPSCHPNRTLVSHTHSSRQSHKEGQFGSMLVIAGEPRQTHVLSPTSARVYLHFRSDTFYVVAHVVSPVCLLRAPWWKGVWVIPSLVPYLGAFGDIGQHGLHCELVCEEGQEKASTSVSGHWVQEAVLLFLGTAATAD